MDKILPPELKSSSCLYLLIQATQQTMIWSYLICSNILTGSRIFSQLEFLEHRISALSWINTQTSGYVAFNFPKSPNTNKNCDQEPWVNRYGPHQKREETIAKIKLTSFANSSQYRKWCSLYAETSFDNLKDKITDSQTVYKHGQPESST